MPRTPPAGQACMVAAALACDREDVSMTRLSQPGMCPHGDRVVALEVAEHPPAGLARAVQPRAFAAPDEGVALAGVVLDRRVLGELGRVGLGERRSVRILGDLPASGEPFWWKTDV